MSKTGQMPMARLNVAAFLLLAISSAASAQTVPAPSAPHPRHVPLRGTANFRDLGGYRTIDGRSIKWGLLYRSDALNALTDDDLRHLVSLNIRRVVDFRTPAEADPHPDRLPLGLRHERFPVPLVVPKPDLSRVNDRGDLDPAAEGAWLEAIDHALVARAYPSFVSESTPSYRAWMQGLLSERPGAQVFHCTGGADRTGVRGRRAAADIGGAGEDDCSGLLADQSVPVLAARASVPRQANAGEATRGTQDARSVSEGGVCGDHQGIRLVR